MKVAYVDTSSLVAVAFAEPAAAGTERRLRGFDRWLASNLVEAEYRATLTREGVELYDDLLTAITWVVPDRPLSREIRSVLEAGTVRGADAWHLATALFVAGELPELTFVTLDSRQREVAASLGLAV